MYGDFVAVFGKLVSIFGRSVTGSRPLFTEMLATYGRWRFRMTPVQDWPREGRVDLWEGPLTCWRSGELLGKSGNLLGNPRIAHKTL